MRLKDLEAEFVKHDGASGHHIVSTLAEADGIMHLCPKCFHDNSGSVGTHSMLLWFRGHVPDNVTPGPGRWTPQGTGMDDLTFVPGNPPMATSILCTGHCHFFIENGSVRMA